MATIQLWNGKILVRHGKIAVGPACCCVDEPPADKCDCGCLKIPDVFINVSYGEDTCEYEFDSFGDAENYCIATFYPKVPGCTVGEEEITSINLYCYKEEGEDRWVIEMIGSYDYYYIDVPIDEDGCPVAGEYTAYAWIHDADLVVTLGFNP